jgi:hypothetical protein
MPMRSQLSSRPKFLNCSICNEPVELESSKIDEDGKPVHEECYVQKTSAQATAGPPTTAPNDSKPTQRPIEQSVVEVLKSASTRATRRK